MIQVVAPVVLKWKVRDLVEGIIEFVVRHGMRAEKFLKLPSNDQSHLVRLCLLNRTASETLICYRESAEPGSLEPSLIASSTCHDLLNGVPAQLGGL